MPEVLHRTAPLGEAQTALGAGDPVPPRGQGHSAPGARRDQGARGETHQGLQQRRTDQSIVLLAAGDLAGHRRHLAEDRPGEVQLVDEPLQRHAAVVAHLGAPVVAPLSPRFPGAQQAGRPHPVDTAGHRRADRPFGDQPAAGAERPPEAQRVAHGQLHPGRGAGVDHLLAAVQIQRHRLLAHHVLAAPRRLRHQLRMARGGRAHDDQIHLVSPHHLICTGRDPCSGFCGPFLGCRPLQVAGQRDAAGHMCFHRLDPCPGYPSATDHTDPIFHCILVGHLLPPVAVGWNFVSLLDIVDMVQK